MTKGLVDGVMNGLTMTQAIMTTIATALTLGATVGATMKSIPRGSGVAMTKGWDERVQTEAAQWAQSQQR